MIICEPTIPIADRPFTISKVPYANHVYRLPADLLSRSPDHLEETLCNAFLQLLDLTVSTVRHRIFR